MHEEDPTFNSPVFAATSRQSPRSRLLLDLLFAMLTAGGGIVLGSGQMGESQGTETIAAIAVFAALIGFVFVDWLKWFELPPLGAYLTMAIAAGYCVREFWLQSDSGRPQMVSVAMLLVLVQGTLMLQRKSRRILEQLAVFCLLELVVAAIFNDALTFGLMLLPIALLGGIALSLLTIVASLEDVEASVKEPGYAAPRTRLERFWDFLASRTYTGQSHRSFVRIASPQSIRQGDRAATAWTRYAMLTLMPAVLLIAAAFFYVLPRRVDASRAVGGGNAVVGFDDKIRLEQLGRLAENSEIALKVEMTSEATEKPYLVNGGLYLRGKTLEIYQVDYSTSRPSASWVAKPPKTMNLTSILPKKYESPSSSARARVDAVRVKITCEAMSRPALFAIAPYYRDSIDQELNADSIHHAVDRWTISRRETDPPFPRIEYSFGTAAFEEGRQLGILGEAPTRSTKATPSIFDLEPFFQGQRQVTQGYAEAIRKFDRRSIPTVVRKANEILESVPMEERSQARVARELEKYLALDPQFTYTLDLDAKPMPNVDPIEQFMSYDRRGHCQYFASTLALMLRSVGIPSRMVVGYRTEEYNSLGGYYIARQSHAHAWVEALIDVGQLPRNLIPQGQRPAQRYWMRLDPTPAASAADDGNAEGVDGLINLANNLWEDYVVEMDRERQEESLAKTAQFEAVQESYEGFFTRLKNRLQESARAEAAGGSWKFDGRLLIQILMGLGLVAAAWATARWIKLPGGGFFKRSSNSSQASWQPEIDYYRAMLVELARLGIERHHAETPQELLHRLSENEAGPLPGTAELTSTFVHQRYGARDRSSRQQLDQSLASLASAVDERLVAKTSKN
ncbi:MAG: transglutaminaseTgpA domain-containing protein [Planctomycetota bacterium]